MPTFADSNGSPIDIGYEVCWTRKDGSAQLGTIVALRAKRIERYNYKEHKFNPPETLTSIMAQPHYDPERDQYQAPVRIQNFIRLDKL